MSELTEQLGKFQVPDGAGIMDGGSPEMPSAEDFARPAVVAPGEPALLPLGIAYYAFWEDAADGMARHARAQVRALAASGLPVRLQSTAPAGKYLLDDEVDQAVRDEVGYLRNVSFAETCLAIRQMVFNSARSLDWSICPAGARLAGFEHVRRVYENTIVYTSWERSTVDRSMVDVLNRCAAVWVPCERNQNVFSEAGVERVHCVPCPFDPGDAFRSARWRLGTEILRIQEQGEKVLRFDDPRVAELMAEAARPLGFAAPRGPETVPDGRRFYAIGKWEPRKGYPDLIGAFLLAFTPQDRVSLFIKTSAWARWEGYDTPDESLARWSADERVSRTWTKEQIARRVLIVSAKLPEGQLRDIHRQNNIYVSSSHGEAWDLPAFDAVAAGNALVHVGYGGSEDYAPAGSVRVPWTLAPVHPGYGWEPDAQWAEYKLDDLVEALRLAEAPRRRVQPPGLYGSYGMPAVGALMREHILGQRGLLSEQVAARLAEAGGFG